MRRVTLIALLVVIGCGEEEPPKTPPPPLEGVELVLAGNEPKTLLRYKLAPHTESQLELAMDADVDTIDVGSVRMPTIVTSIDVAITDVDASGAKLKTTVVKGGARPRDPSTTDNDMLSTVRLLDRATSLLGGLVVSVSVTPDGKASGSKIESVGRDLSEPMQQQVGTFVQFTENLAMPLPDKPVGVGGMWKYRRTFQQNQLTLVATTRIEVIAIDGDRVTFKGTTDLVGADQTITNGSASAQVTKIGGTGTLSGTFDLSKVIVLGEIQQTLGFEMIVDGKTRPTKFGVTMHITPRAAASPESGSDAGAPTGSGDTGGHKSGDTGGH